MSTSINTTKILKSVVAATYNKLVAAKLCTRQFDGEFKGEIGNVAYINAPQRFKAYPGTTITALQAPNARKIPIIVDQPYVVPVTYPVHELALALEDPTTNLFNEIARPLAVTIDQAILGLASQVPHYTGTPGASIDSGLYVLQAGAMLTQAGADRDKPRVLIINSDANVGIQQNLKSLLLPSPMMKDLIGKASLGYQLYNNEIVLSENILKHNPSTSLSGASPVVASTSNGIGGGTLSISGLTASQTLNAGEVFKIDGVYEVNIDNGHLTGNLQQFVVKNTVTASADGNATVNIYPEMVSTGAYRNVNAFPASGATITPSATSSALTVANNLIITKDAFALVTVPVPPLKFAWSQTVSYEGISVTMSANSDIVHYYDIVRFDVWFGVKAINPDFAIRIFGK